jgi:WD40 repeat protein
MKGNPYIGPRPFERQDFYNFYGRAREARDLLSLILANRVVLFYAQSGAGKTSLLNAQIIPDLEERGFNVLPVTRVGSDLPPGIDPKSVKNIFVFSVLMGLAGKDIPATELTQETLLRFLRMRKLMGVAVETQTTESSEDATLLVTGPQRPPILILDQFEEILTTHRDHWQAAQGFFEQLAEALRGLPELGVALAMREDHVAGLDPYAVLLPKRLKARYRMGLLAAEGALEAVVKPASRAGAPFAPGVAEKLVDDLRRIRALPSTVAEGEAGDGGAVLGPNVEPVQLQVVCNRLWENLPDDLDHDIGWEEVEKYGNIDRALTEFYESAIAHAYQVCKKLTDCPINEHQLREWFGKQMITPAQTRGLALRGEQDTAGLPNQVVGVLENQHLIRADARGGTLWYELVHDRLVEPILQSNREWEAARQTPLRLAAQHWCETQSDGLLYRDKALKDGLAWVQAHPDDVESCETDFLEASQRAEQRRFRRRRLYVTGAIVSAVVLIVMIVLALSAVQGQRNAQAAERGARAAEAVAVARSTEAIAQRQVAETAQAIAEAQRQVAVTSRADAVAQQTVAVAERNRAEDQARIAFARELAAQALRSAAEKQTDLGLLLSLEANRFANAIWARDNLLGVFQTNPNLITHLHGHTDSVWSVAFSSDGKMLASGSADGTIRLWNVATHQPLGEALSDHTGDVYSVAFSPDGKVLAWGTAYGTITLLNVATRRPLGQPLTGHARAVNSVAFSPDGKTLASGSLDATIRLWDVTSGLPLGQPLAGHTSDVYSVAFSSDGKTLASGSADGTIRLWDVATRRQIGQPLTGHTGSVWSVSFSPTPLGGGTGSKVLASGSSDATIRLWDVATGKPLNQPITGHRGPVWSVTFSPDGMALASGSSDGTARLWDVTTGKPLGQPFTSPAGQVNSVAFSPNGQILASAGKDGIIRLWNIATRPLLGQPITGITGQVNSVAFSPDSKTLVSGGTNGSLLLWDVTTQQPLGQPLTDTSNVTSVAFSPDGKVLASGNVSGTIRLWDVSTALNTSVATRQPLGELVADHTGDVYSVAFSPAPPGGGTGDKVLASGSADGTIHLWDVATRQPLGLPITATGDVYSVAFSPSGKVLASGGKDGAISLWDVETRQPLGQPLTGHAGDVTSLAFSPVGQVLASGGKDGVIRLWDVATRQPLGLPLTGHTDAVNSVAFSPDGKMLASGSSDSTIRLWDVEAHQSIGQPLIGSTGHVTSVAFSPDGKRLASGSDSDPTIILWDVNPESWQALACWMTNRDLTLAEWNQYFRDRPNESYRKTCEQAILAFKPTPISTPVTPTPTPTGLPAALATAPVRPLATPTPGVNLIGPIGSGEFQAAWTGTGNCTMQERQDANGARYWFWEADFYVEVHGGNAGYTISSSQCRWDSILQKYVCRWGAREDGIVIQNVTVSCPGCKPVALPFFQSASRGRGNVCELK